MCVWKYKQHLHLAGKQAKKSGYIIFLNQTEKPRQDVQSDTHTSTSTGWIQSEVVCVTELALVYFCLSYSTSPDNQSLLLLFIGTVKPTVPLLQVELALLWPIRVHVSKDTLLYMQTSDKN